MLTPVEDAAFVLLPHNYKQRNHMSKDTEITKMIKGLDRYHMDSDLYGQKMTAECDGDYIRYDDLIKAVEKMTAQNDEDADLHPLRKRLILIFQKSIRSNKRDKAENTAWDSIKDDVTESDVAALESFYALPKSAECDATWNRKTAVAQLMNQFVSQVEKAQSFSDAGPTSSYFDDTKTI